MSILDGLRERVRHLLRRRELEQELDEELAFHVSQEQRHRQEEGCDPQRARREAAIALGSLDRAREEVRDVWTGNVLVGVLQDIRIGMRRLVQRPLFTVVALLTLALGIGANTAMFSLVRGVLLAPFPYGSAERLVMVWKDTGNQTEETWLSARELMEYRSATRSFTDLAAHTNFNASLTEGDTPERVRASAVTANMFSTLRVPALRGRTFTESEDVPGADDVVVLGHDLWQRRFGGASMIGEVIRVNGEPRRVVGIMPAGFRLPLDYRDERATELWVPAAIDLAGSMPWGSRSYYVVGRLADDVSAVQATEEIARVHDRWLEAGHLTNSDGGLNRAVFPLDALLLGNIRPALLVLFGAVALILVIACANVMHLILARSDARRREVATQAALGASRGRIARQLLIESGLLAGAGALMGLVLGWMTVRAAAALVPVNIIRAREITLDVPVLAFTVGLALAATVLAGLAPALQLSRVNVAQVMATSRGAVAPMRRRMRRGLVVLETALSLVLVIGAVLLARSFIEMRRIDLGFATANTLTMRIELPSGQYTDDEGVSRFFASLVDEVEALTGVESAGAVRVLPLTQAIGDWSITIEGRESRAEEALSGDWQVATPGYLETMQIPLIEGRYPADTDAAASPPVAVVNQAMAERYWPEGALGRRFHLGTLDQPWVEIVGVIADVRHNAVTEELRDEMVLVHSQFVRVKNGGSPVRGMSLAVRTAGDPLALVTPIREILRRMDPQLPVTEVRTLDDVAADALAQPRFTATLLVVFAGLALLLAVLGLYGVISFIAARRTNELGIRLALGARPGSLTRMVMTEGLVLAAAGVALGVPGAAFLAQLLETQLYGVLPLDPATFMVVPAVLLAVAGLAAYLPARRAAGVNPVVALLSD